MIQQFIHTIAKEEIAKLTVEEFKGRIITILSKEEADKAVEYLLRFPIVGFDTETRPSFVPLESYRYTGISGEIPKKQFDLKDRVIFTG